MQFAYVLSFRATLHLLVDRVMLAVKEASVVITNKLETGDCGLTRDSPIASGRVPPKRIARTGRSTGVQQQQAFVESVVRKAPPKEVAAPLSTLILVVMFCIRSETANAVRSPSDTMSKTLPTEKYPVRPGLGK